MKHSEMDFRYTMTFSQCVHGMYDEKMEAVYRKCSQNASFEEDSESTSYINGGLLFSIVTNTGNKICEYILWINAAKKGILYGAILGKGEFRR